MNEETKITSLKRGRPTRPDAEKEKSIEERQAALENIATDTKEFRKARRVIDYKERDLKKSKEKAAA